MNILELSFGESYNEWRPYEDENPTESASNSVKTLNQSEPSEKGIKKKYVVVNPRKCFTSEEEDLIKELYYNQNLSMHVIAMAMGCTHRAIKNKIFRLGRPNGISLPQDPEKEKESERLRTLCQSSMTLEEIAKTMGKSVRNVEHKKNRLGIKRNIKQKTSRNKYTEDDVERLKELYLNQNKSRDEIANILGRPYYNVNYKIYQLGLTKLKKNQETNESQLEVEKEKGSLHAEPNDPTPDVNVNEVNWFNDRSFAEEYTYLFGE